MKGRGSRVLSCLALCFLAANAAASDCERATVDFPNRNIHLDVNTTPTTVHFTISDGCFYKITITNGQGECSVRKEKLRNKECSCSRTGAGVSCSTTRTFPRRTSETWRVKVALKGEVHPPQTEVNFNVSYPTKLENFTVSHHGNKSLITVKKGNNVQFSCHWKQGNPKKSIELRGPQNKVREHSNHQFTDRWTLSNFTCADSGEYRCQVEGTDEFKSLTVLVECPLVFKPQSPSIPEQVVPAGGDATFSFPVASYSATLHTCQLTKPDGTPVDCNSTTSVVHVLGSPPDLTVTVTLKDVTEKDGGTWTLAASNPYRTPWNTVPTISNKRFHLVVTEPTKTSSEKVAMTTSAPSSLPTSRLTTSALDSGSPSQPAQSRTMTIAIAGGAGVVLVTIIVLGICYVRKRGNSQGGANMGSRQRKQPAPTEEGRMFVNETYGDSECAREIANSMYESADGPAAVATVSGALYEAVDDVGKTGVSPQPPRSHGTEAGDNTYVAQEEIRRNKAKKKGKDTAPAEEQMYVGQEEIQRNKARNKAKAKKDGKEKAPAEEQMYVGQEEIQRNKARNKAKAKKDGKEKGGDVSEAVYVDQDQIRRNKALSQQRKNNKQ